jgi:class 3 adenylate cyclase
MTQMLMAGREALRRHAWGEALEALAGVDADDGLDPDDLQLLAQAAWWSGQPDAALEAWERAYAAYSAAGENTAAAGVAIRLAELAFRRVAFSIGAGWVARAERLLESEPESAVHAWLKFIHAADALFRLKDWDATIELADEAIALGRAHGDTDVQSIALAFKGSALVRKGQWAEGVALFDEATASAVSGELDPKTACDVYCNTIASCRLLSDHRRAGEWTEQADRWMARQEIRGYRGACRLHRAELKRLQGSWAEAEQEVKSACTELEEFRLLDVVGEAHYELGELRLHMGDLVAAEESFNRAYEFGRDPQPGLALLLLARGETEEAARAIGQTLSGDGAEPGAGAAQDVLNRTHLLPAQVEIALAGGDLDTARAAVEEMEGIVDGYDNAALRAASLNCRGALQLAERNTAEAVATLGQAWRLWQEIELPYESARARLLLGSARIAAGDDKAGRLDVRSARTVFERLGAAIDLRAADEILGGDDGSRPRGHRDRVVMTFMFTDIVTSTDLVGLIGDEAWEELLRWHDRTLRATFAIHGGEEVRHTGDGFFVAFADAGVAADCAVDIQRRLADHRRQHGFAPWVRIGLHTAEATYQAGDYSGKGVHVAARVGGIADREQIVISQTAAAAAGAIRFPLTEPRVVSLKGVTEPLQVSTLEWR